MKVIDCKVGKTVTAKIKLGLFKSTIVKIPARNIMYILSDPLKWDEIDTLEINKDSLGEIADVLFEMRQEDNQVLAELLLKVAGKHHNPFENQMMKEMLTNREFAKSQRRLM
ncbi:MAG: hypothetical protein WDZ35_07920 [Crocinitomicaceae bacterium]